LIQVWNESLEEREFAKVPEASNMPSVPLNGSGRWVPTRMKCSPFLLSLDTLKRLLRKGWTGKVPQECEAMPETRLQRSKPRTRDTQTGEEGVFVEEPAEMEGDCSVI
jgi:hypothetical protein